MLSYMYKLGKGIWALIQHLSIPWKIPGIFTNTQSH